MDVSAIALKRPTNRGVGLFACVWARGVAVMVRLVSYSVLVLRRFFVCSPGVVGGEPRLGR